MSGSIRAAALVAATTCLFACGDDTDRTGIGVQLYNADGLAHDGLLRGDQGAFINIVAVRTTDGTVIDEDTASLAGGKGGLGGLPVDVPVQLFVRGYNVESDVDVAAPTFFGSTRPFTVASGEEPRVGIQIGRSDCVGAMGRPPAGIGTTGNIDLNERRAGFTATELGDGRVVVAGGMTIGRDGQVTGASDAIEVFDPNTGRIQLLGSRLLTGRAFHTATLLADDLILLVGGLTVRPDTGQVAVLASVTLLDFSTATPVEQRIEDLPEGDERFLHTATLLEDGTVLIAGGMRPDGGEHQSAWRFFPRRGGSGQLLQQGPMCRPRAFHTVSKLPDLFNMAAVIGGKGTRGDGSHGPHAEIEIFTINPNQGQCSCGGLAAPSAEVGCFVHPRDRELSEPRWGHKTVLVDSDRYVVVGGYASESGDQMATSVEMLIGETLSVASGVGTITDGRAAAAIAGIGEDAILVAGGCGAGPANPSGDLKDIRTLWACPSASPTLTATKLEPTRDMLGRVTGFTERPLPQECGLSEHRFGTQAVPMSNGLVGLVSGVTVVSDGLNNSGRMDLFFPAATNLTPIFRR